MKQYINITFSILLGLAFFTSCEDLLEVTPEEVLLSDDFQGDDELDVRSALFGVLAEMQEITGQYIVLGELRADLADVNANSEDELRQINNHDINPNNSYINPVKLFSIINNCNFALEAIDTEIYEGRLFEDYASILRIRTWAQLQIVINYGELAYITKPIKSNVDLEETYPLLSFNQAIDQLIENLQIINDVENVSKYENSQGFNIFKMIPDQDVLLGDLNLWKGSFVTAATHYKQFLDKNVTGGGSLYNLTGQYGVSYTGDTSNYNTTNNWGNIFQDNIQGNEVINYVGYSDDFRQPNNSFSVLTNQIKPSSLIILNWSEQLKGFEGLPFAEGDNRAEESYIDMGEMSQISKYQYDYFTWNRVVKVYLRYAEAINFAGYPLHALTILNGIFNNADVAPQDALIFNNPEPFLNFEMEQYYIVNNSDVPVSGNMGIRGRVGLAPLNVPEDTTGVVETIEKVGEFIMNEAALELAFEGSRWEDLLRFSMRQNDPSIIANAVSRKFENAGNIGLAAEIRIKLMNPENWFLPIDYSR
ncbi:RagB/SusD family nutrient uptake outer membrane protein [Algibacter mikhailovii]|uniref:RagB/SusD family nutrient uptake outer membrane protein n=1 Tax=Algibacter mikhailovii TaxID=425498 RepID=UPI002494732B|nr:RagB/SusD family nutrient uptake outer membrane protein [Algibacter mikhailovii]